jgi:hypothetical protein
MAKDKEELVKQTIEQQKALDSLTVDKIAETVVVEPEIQTKITMKELAASEGIPYIEPKRRLTGPLGKLPDKLKQEHARAWEYVKGIYENFECPGDSIKFSLSLYPGDSDYLWEVPANRPVYVPRMVANHLESCQMYHKFAYIDMASNQLGPGGHMQNFAPTQTTYRGKFRPIGAFA